VAAGGCWWLPLLLLVLLLLLLLLLQSTSLSKQETNSQTPFAKHIRSSKTPPNFVPKMPGGRNNPISNPILTAAAAGGC